MAASGVSDTLSSIAGAHLNNGSVQAPVNSGKGNVPGSGVRSAGTGGPGGGTAQLAQAVLGQGRAPQPKMPKPPSRPPQQHPAKFSAQNPMMGTAPPPIPHPGVVPPFPDARSAQPTMMPNGQVVMPPPKGLISANMSPRVPATFIPGMSGLLGR